MSINRTLLLAFLLALVSACSMTPEKEDNSAKPGEFNELLNDNDGKVVKDSKRSLEELKTGEEAHARAEKSLRDGDKNMALFYYVKALELNTKDSAALFAIGDIHSELGNLQLANKAYRMGLALDKDNVKALEGLGINLTKLSVYNVAEVMLKRALELDPKRLRALNALAVISDMRGDFNGAKGYYKQAMELQPDNPRILNNYAYSRYLAGEWREAENVFKQILKRHPRHYQAALNYGLLQARQGKGKQALASFQRVLKRPQAYNELGYIMMLEKKFDEAEQLFRKAMSSSPTYFAKAVKNLEEVKARRNEVKQSGSNAELTKSPAVTRSVDIHAQGGRSGSM